MSFRTWRRVDWKTVTDFLEGRTTRIRQKLIFLSSELSYRLLHVDPEDGGSLLHENVGNCRQTRRFIPEDIKSWTRLCETRRL